MLKSSQADRIPTKYENISTSLSVFLHAECIRRGWSVEQLASKACIPSKDLGFYLESGRHQRPSKELLAKLAFALEVPYSVLRQMCEFPSPDLPVPEAVSELLRPTDVALPELNGRLSLQDIEDSISATLPLLQDPDKDIRSQAALRLKDYHRVYAKTAAGVQNLIQMVLEDAAEQEQDPIAKASILDARSEVEQRQQMVAP